ncbi:hypothetical protein V428_05965 [Aeromonas hydrophila subsp. hydrophila AL09-71]|nr:hypothetical protein AHML_05745 [Aeromonas hydrophila ML09-119]AHX31637.1 hypothetical protein V428_05965 [Aeromonas hydrophila subsp. hydrophila AL09-71]AHX68433.1 hypothetical protein V429_05965 [Aeromonas hydrophila pc104A]AJE38654.1 hypothetical protein V469_17380 [Aeromonas hydrophila J-1]
MRAQLIRRVLGIITIIYIKIALLISIKQHSDKRCSDTTMDQVWQLFMVEQAFPFLQFTGLLKFQ